MGPLRLTAWALVLASVVANGALWLRRPRGEAPAPGAVDDPRTEAAPATAPSVPAREVPPGALARCQSRLAAAERDVQDRSGQLRRVLPLARLFRIGRPNPEAAALLGPLVERVLLGLDGGAVPAHSLECRDVVCRLLFVSPTDGDSDGWMQALQRRDTELRRHVSGMSFHVGNPTQDPITREGLQESAVYLRLGEGQQPRGSNP